jgi:hypothetical protein
MLVHPLWLNIHIYHEPSSASTFTATLEGSREVLLSAVAAKRQHDPREDNLLISSRGIEVLEQDGIRCNPQPAFTQYREAAKGSDGVRIEMNQLTPNMAHHSNKNLLGGSPSPGTR